jgi:hypothetical protein
LLSWIYKSKLHKPSSIIAALETVSEIEVDLDGDSVMTESEFLLGLSGSVGMQVIDTDNEGWEDEGEDDGEEGVSDSEFPFF